MKKIIALFSSLFILAGLKAQTTPARKETTGPSSEKPAIRGANTFHKVTDKVAPTQKMIKDIKGTNPYVTKGNPATQKVTPATVKMAPGTIKDAPATIKGAPASIKGAPATIKGAPAAKESPVGKQ